MTDPLILTESEIQRLTGYKRPADQLRELHRQGFHRAHLATATLGRALATVGQKVPHSPAKKVA